MELAVVWGRLTNITSTVRWMIKPGSRGVQYRGAPVGEGDRRSSLREKTFQGHTKHKLGYRQSQEEGHSLHTRESRKGWSHEGRDLTLRRLGRWGMESTRGDEAGCALRGPIL